MKKINILVMSVMLMLNACEKEQSGKSTLKKEGNNSTSVAAACEKANILDKQCYGDEEDYESSFDCSDIGGKCQKEFQAFLDCYVTKTCSDLENEDLFICEDQLIAMGLCDGSVIVDPVDPVDSINEEIELKLSGIQDFSDLSSIKFTKDTYSLTGIKNNEEVKIVLSVPDNNIEGIKEMKNHIIMEVSKSAGSKLLTINKNTFQTLEIDFSGKFQEIKSVEENKNYFGIKYEIPHYNGNYNIDKFEILNKNLNEYINLDFPGESVQNIGALTDGSLVVITSLNIKHFVRPDFIRDTAIDSIEYSLIENDEIFIQSIKYDVQPLNNFRYQTIKYHLVEGLLEYDEDLNMPPLKTIGSMGENNQFFVSPIILINETTSGLILISDKSTNEVLKVVETSYDNSIFISKDGLNIPNYIYFQDSCVIESSNFDICKNILPEDFNVESLIRQTNNTLAAIVYDSFSNSRKYFELSLSEIKEIPVIEEFDPSYIPEITQVIIEL